MTSVIRPVFSTVNYKEKKKYNGGGLLIIKKNITSLTFFNLTGALD